MSTTIEPKHSQLPALFQANRTAVLSRLVWKDFRELLPVWIVILAGAAFCMFLLNLSPLSGGRYTSAFKDWTLLCCQGFAVLICVVNGVLLFALEEEKQTHMVLSSLPAHPQTVIWTKLAIGLVGTYTTILLLTWGGGWISYAASGSMPDTGLLAAETQSKQAVLSIVPMTFFMVSAIVALLAGSTVNAFVIAGFLSLVGCAASGYIGVDHYSYRAKSFVPAGVLFAVLLITLGIAWTDGQRWIEGRKRKWFSRRSVSATSITERSVDPEVRRRGDQLFPVLMWQSWRIASPKILLWVVAVIGCSFPFLLSPEFRGDAFLTTSSFIIPAIAAGLSLVFNATIFQADHQQGLFRFYQQHVERPRWFWLTRLIPWTLAMLGIAALWTFGVSRIANEQWLDEVGTYHTIERFFRYLLTNGGAFATMILLTALAIGQFWSMFVRNFVIAIVFSLITGGVIYWCVGWLIFMGESLTVFLLPLIVALFWATWYRARFWLADDRRWIGYAVPISTIVATIGLLLAGFNYHRANEIPEPQIDVNNIASLFPAESGRELTKLQFGTPTERAETANLYRKSLQEIGTESFEKMMTAQRVRQLWDAVKEHRDSIERGSDTTSDLAYPDFDQRVRDFVKENQTAIELVIEASKRTGCDPFLDPNSSDSRFQQTNKLRSLMMAWALVNLNDENIDGALEAIFAFNRVCERTSLGSDYVNQNGSRQQFHDLLIRWGELPNQTVETLRPVIRRLEYDVSRETRQGVQISPVYSQPHKNMHWTNYRYWGGEREWFSLIHQFQEIDNNSIERISNLPWLGRVFYASSEQRVNRLRKKIAIEKFPDRYWYTGHYTVNYGTNWQRTDWQWTTESTVSDGDRRFYRLEEYSPRGFIKVQNSIFEETLRRYTLTRLALMSYRAEHGEYPQTLEQLFPYFQPNRYQTTIPKTAVGGQDFAWFPEGVPEGVFRRVHSSNEEIEPNRPTLFPFAVYRPIDFADTVEYEIDENGKDVTKQGVRLPIVSGTSIWFADISNIYLSKDDAPE